MSRREQLGDRVGHVAQQVGAGQEPELVEVDAGGRARGQDELAVQLGGLDHPPDQVVAHGA